MPHAATPLALTQDDANRLPPEFNDGFGRPSLARAWGDIVRADGSELFVECGGSLIFSDIVVGPKASIQALARDALPRIEALLTDFAEDDPEERPVGFFALWESE